MTLSLSLTIILLCILNEVNADIFSRRLSGMFYYVYLDVNQMVKWQQAMAMCAREGMNLVDIPTNIEHDRINSLVDDAKQLVNNDTVIRFWTSGSDLAYPHKWTWVTTGQWVAYTNWHANEPNRDNPNERCLAVEWRKKTANVGWNDFDCGQNAYFICRSTLDVPLLSENFKTINPN